MGVVYLECMSNPEENPICLEQGHDWTYYTVSTGYYGNDIEQAGICKKCGYDTHKEENENVKST